jgi:hypothetical protein
MPTLPAADIYTAAVYIRIHTPGLAIDARNTIIHGPPNTSNDALSTSLCSREVYVARPSPQSALPRTVPASANGRIVHQQVAAIPKVDAAVHAGGCIAPREINIIRFRRVGPAAPVPARTGLQFTQPGMRTAVRGSDTCGSVSRNVHSNTEVGRCLARMAWDLITCDFYGT